MKKILTFLGEWWGAFLFIGWLALMLLFTVGNTIHDSKQENQIYQFLRDESWSDSQAKAWIYKYGNPRQMSQGYLPKYIEWCEDKKLEWK